ncbi:glutathione S-transferase N-terminal domain-containing protein [Microdochium nivale]|nr:glutathione S-transferase N-terminal domain-containing protein [Microdochium nivale]
MSTLAITSTTTTTTMTHPKMDFYDIAMRPPIEETACSVNPWKARLALNFKAADYSTTWVSLPDIPRVRTSLGVPPCRLHATGEGYPTLPVLVDHATGTKTGDSFDMAVYLDETYPDAGAGRLLPPRDDNNDSIGYTFGQELAAWMPPLSDMHLDPRYAAYARFNREVDLAFTTHVALMGYFLPVDDDASRQVFLDRAGLSSWEQLNLTGAAREDMLDKFREMLRDMAAQLYHGGRDRGEGGRNTAGQQPWVAGAQKATYADLILGGWLFMASRTLPAEEWRAVREGNGGVFGRLFDALQKWAEVK